MLRHFDRTYSLSVLNIYLHKQGNIPKCYFLFIEICGINTNSLISINVFRDNFLPFLLNPHIF